MTMDTQKQRLQKFCQHALRWPLDMSLQVDFDGHSYTAVAIDSEVKSIKLRCEQTGEVFEITEITG